MTTYCSRKKGLTLKWNFLKLKTYKSLLEQSTLFGTRLLISCKIFALQISLMNKISDVDDQFVLEEFITRDGAFSRNFNLHFDIYHAAA